MDEPILTNYPHERLSRLADAMTDVLPDGSGIRAIVFIDDDNGGIVHPWGYPEPEPPLVNSLIFLDAAAHLYDLGRALGFDVGIIINGQNVPFTIQENPDRR